MGAGGIPTQPTLQESYIMYGFRFSMARLLV